MMSTFKPYSKALLAITTLLLTACIGHQQYRTNYNLCVSEHPETECLDSALQKYQFPSDPRQDYTLGFIEFDDQGQLWSREQMNQVVGHLQGNTGDQLIVVFVHGWEHSAKPGDNNIAMFRRSLRKLSALESTINKQPRDVAGIYLGWRGGSVSAPLINKLTFWERKNTAHKVGYGAVTEVLSRLEKFRKAKNMTSKSDTRLVIVGHSFGGAVVYSAVSEILEHGFVQTTAGSNVTGNAKGFGDLVVLLNPAFEALRFSSLSDMSTERKTYFVGQLPVLAVLTSETDYATAYAFPAGRWFSTLFEKEREVDRSNPVIKQSQVIDQGDANRQTIGHFDSYKTHDLKALDDAVQSRNSEFNLRHEIEQFLAIRDSWKNDHPGSVILFDGSALTRTIDSTGRNPYLNIRVDTQLIPNHNRIDDPRVQSFLRQLILVSSQGSNQNSPKTMRIKAENSQ